MDSTGLKSLQKATNFCFRPRASLFRPFNLIQLKHILHLYLTSYRISPLCTLNGEAEICQESTLPCGTGEAVNEASRPKILQVVLVSPQIPGNTGAVARTCAASAVGLHLVGPMAFKVDSNKLKRAGLDYWPYPSTHDCILLEDLEVKSDLISTRLHEYVVVKIHDSWADFQDYFRKQEGEKRLLAFTKRGTKVHSEFSYRKGDYLLFGSETSGLPPEALQDCNSEPYGGGTIRIPIVETYVRCLNLSVSVGIALYEASRQLNYEQIQTPSVTSTDTEESLITEDIFG